MNLFLLMYVYHFSLLFQKVQKILLFGMVKFSWKKKIVVMMVLFLFLDFLEFTDEIIYYSSC